MTSTFCLVRVRDCRFRLVAIYQFMYSVHADEVQQLELVTFQKRSASSDATNDEDEEEDEMITRLEREKEVRRNRRKRAKFEVSESAELEEETEKECSVCLIETKRASPVAETAAAAGEYPKSSNEDDSDAKKEPKEESEKCSQSTVAHKPELTSAEDSTKTDEKTEGEDYEVERIVDYSWCRETVSGFSPRRNDADNSHIS